MSTHGADRPHVGPRWTVVGWLIVVVYLVGAAVALWAERNISAFPPEESVVPSLLLWLGFGWFALIGAIIVSRQPRNPMGWLLAAVALGIAVSASSHSVASYLLLERGRDATLPLSLAAWPNNWYWYVTMALVLVYVPLLFPTGHLLSPRWRVVAWMGAVGVAGVSGLGAVAGEIGLQVSQTSDGPGASIPNPLGVGGLAHVEQLPLMAPFTALLGGALLGATCSLFVRFRRSRGIERQQMKWLVLVAALLPPIFGLEFLLEVVELPLLEELRGLGFFLVLNAIPLAIGFGVLRYRLYEIDRVISRTIAYSLVVATLGATYAAAAVVLGRVLTPVDAGNDLAVAAATLTAVGVSQPLRRRVRSVVDRRFNRARYDAQLTVAAFGQRLRNEVDLDTLSAELREAVVETLQPGGVGVWLAKEPLPGARPRALGSGS